METKNKVIKPAFARLSSLTLLIFSTLSLHTANAQAPAVVGIDHIGINVPNMDQAINFFHDMFGFSPVTKLGPFPMNADWKKKFHIHNSADQVELVMLRAGDGANIELFAYKPNSGSQVQPFRDDLDAYHMAIYTRNIKATKSFLESKGIRFLSDIQSGAGDTEGESWVYFETPWGSTIELNSYPQGKGYEKHNPAVKLWNASSMVELNTTTLTETQLQSFVNLQLKIWNNTNAASRMADLGELYLDNVAFFDHEAIVNGLKELNNRITQLQQKLAGFRFTPVKVDNSNNVVRYYWYYGPESNPKLVSGMDLMIIENGKVRSLHVFLDHLPEQSKK